MRTACPDADGQSGITLSHLSREGCPTDQLRNWNASKEVIALLRFLDWLIRLPKGIQEEYHDRIKNDLEVRTVMPYLLDLERIAIEKGRKEGLEQGREQGRREGLIQALTLGLRLRFGEEGLKLLPEIQKITSSALLSDLVNLLLRESSKEEFERQLRRTIDGEKRRP